MSSTIEIFQKSRATPRNLPQFTRSAEPVLKRQQSGLRSSEDRKPFEFKMGRERVKSKNLFNFRPQGFLDKDIEEFYEKGKVTLLCSYFKSTKNIEKLPSVKVVQVGLTNNSVASWSDKMKNMSESDFVGMMRQLMDKNIATSSMVVDPALIEASSSSI